jgi:hypothetical protein
MRIEQGGKALDERHAAEAGVGAGPGEQDKARKRTQVTLVNAASVALASTPISRSAEARATA